MIFLLKELDNKQRIIDMLPQQISENSSLIHQVENTSFNNDTNVFDKSNLMKDTVKEINVLIRLMKKGIAHIDDYSILAANEGKPGV